MNPPAVIQQKQGWTSFDDSPTHSQQSGQGNVQSWMNFPEAENVINHSGKVQATAKLGYSKQPKFDHKKPEMVIVQKQPAESKTKHSVPLASPQHSTKTIANDPGQLVQAKHQKGDDENKNVHSKEPDNQDPWCINDEQREYYTRQFVSMQASFDGKIDGQTARSFFTKSKLPIIELSHIWELSDMDQDGLLTLNEFCTAFHLVVARKNGYELPTTLPQSLIPESLDKDNNNDSKKLGVSGGAQTGAKPKGISSDEKNDSEWETFTDGESLAKFQETPQKNDDLHHPVAIRPGPTPQKPTPQWKDGGESSSKVETVDEESTTSSPHIKAVKDNPYGFLRNELSEAESSGDEHKQNKCSRQSSVSSIVLSNHSSDIENDREDDDEYKEMSVRSDLELSDWSSRPLRPKSESSSSLDSEPMPGMIHQPSAPSTSSNVQQVAAPTPPPRPKLTTTTSASAAVGFIEKDATTCQVAAAEEKKDVPSLPPRPSQQQQQLQPAASDQQQQQKQEFFADFSKFSTKTTATNIPPPPTSPMMVSQPKQAETAAAEKQQQQTTVRVHSRVTAEEATEDVSEKSVAVSSLPAPTTTSSTSAAELKEQPELKSDEVKNKKPPPTKPPRKRTLVNEVVDSVIATCKPIHDQDQLAPAPQQNLNRTKKTLESEIRALKDRNLQLSRLNADLQRQLKDVMETRIMVEMDIHKLRPFTE